MFSSVPALDCQTSSVALGRVGSRCLSPCTQLSRARRRALRRSVVAHSSNLKGSESTSHAANTKRQLLQSLTAVPLLSLAGQTEAANQPAPQKLKNLPIEQVMERLKKGLIDDQYFVTGKVPREIFADDCVFSDPTQTTHGIAWYSKAVPTLFNPDPSKSRVDVIDIKVRDGKTIDLKWRLAAQLNVPGLRYNFKPYTGSAVYRTNDDGLINQQKESWDISIADAFISTFVPSYGAPPAPPIEELIKREKENK